MSILPELQARFRRAVAPWGEDPEPLVAMIRRSQDPRFGDYQANFAMPLGKRLGRPPRDVAAEVVDRLEVGDFCEPAQVAGPGFINLKIRDDWIAGRLARASVDPRLGIPPVDRPKTYVIDYSAPNVAKPMHVGHIRSTVIGDALAKTLRFAGHRVITDNHIGDWGTQFGMIIYGYKHFLNETAFRKNPVDELARLYRLVRVLVHYYELREEIPKAEELLTRKQAELAEIQKQLGDKPAKKAKKKLDKQRRALSDSESRINMNRLAYSQMEQGPGPLGLDGEPMSEDFPALLRNHSDIRSAVLAETAKLHAGDEENLELWRRFLPPCEEEIERIYQRLDVAFDHTLGESFYHDRLGGIVEELMKRKIATESDGAICVFLEGHDVPMIVRKQDGAFLYATTDLATLGYRMETWRPSAILYVVDFRQSLHFEHLFAATRRLGHDDVELQHVKFGTVLGNDGKPFKTRSGDTVGLEGLLDEAVRRAGEIVGANDDAKPTGAELSPEERRDVAETVGIAALKYADLSQNRESDYVFSYDKMLAMNGNTATYMQYAYARVRSIFRRGKVDVAALRAAAPEILLDTPAERALALELLRFWEAVDLVLKDYRPNQMTAYLFELANCYSTFFEHCPVLKAETPASRQSRLLLCDLTARTIQKGLELLGIDVVEKM